MVHEEYREMIAARALSALDEGEARTLDTHLETCSECQSEMEEFQSTAAWLALDATPKEPSPQLRARILTLIKSPTGVSSDGQTSDKTATAPLLQMPVPPVRRWTTVQRWGAIAAGFMILTLGLSLFALWWQNLNARRELAQLSREMDQMRQQQERQREATSVLTAPGARLAELSGTEVAPSAHAMLAFDQSGRAVLMTKSLPPPPEGKAYQLWFISGGQKIPGKVFTTNEAGEGTLSDHIPRHALNSAVFAITLEPEGGVTEPTGQIYLVSGS